MAHQHRIGVMFSTAGSYSVVSRAMLNGALLAFREIAEACGPLALEPVIVNPSGDLARYRELSFELLRAGIRHVVGCKPVHGGAVYASLFIGINQFLLRNDMYERLQDLEERRRGRRAVVRAIISLMQSGLDEDGAYDQLRRESMRARQSLELYREELPNKRPTQTDSSGRPTSVTLQGDNKRAM